MARLIPGRLRNEGINLCKSGQVELLEEGTPLSRFQVGEDEVFYDVTDQLTSCSCQLFLTKDYCQHLAGVEHYVKHQTNLLAASNLGEELSPQVRQEHEFGRRFLEQLGQVESQGVKFVLAAEGELSPYAHKIEWTLKLRRLPDKRYYVVRDIVAFLKLVKQKGHYQVGQHYYEPLALELFDVSSQELITFLWRLASSDSRVFFPNNQRHLYLPAGFFEEGMGLLGQLSQFQLVLGYSQLDKCPPFVPLTPEADLYRFKVRVLLETIELTVDERAQDSFFEGQYLYDRGTFYVLDSWQHRLAQALQGLPINSQGEKQLTLGVADQAQLAQHLLDFAALGPVEAPKAFESREFEAHFTLDLLDGEMLQLRTRFDYQGLLVSDQETFSQLPFVSNLKHQKAIEKGVRDLGFRALFESKRFLPQGAERYDLLVTGVGQLRRLGTVVLSDQVKALLQQGRPQIQLERQGGLLDISFDFADLDANEVAMALQHLYRQDPYFISPSGQVVVFDDDVMAISKTLQALRAKQVGQSFQLATVASLQFKEALGHYDQQTWSADLAQMAKHLAKPETFALPDHLIQGQLRPYQKQGVQWLSMLDHYGFGGILADDMGLGKTLQTIAFLSHPLRLGKRVLILAPSSLIYNWQEEFAKFSPDQSVAVVHGSKASREELIASDTQVLVSSYQSFRQDLEAYQEAGIDYLILDEAQFLKNSQTKIAQALRTFEVERCFALSGTPIENRLLEIWSIFQIVLPGLFVSKSQFKSLSPQAVAKIIQPFVLRRKKDEVLTELPDVMEMTYVNDMTPEQKVLYLAQLGRMRQQVAGVNPADFSKERMSILAGITRLRQICNTPKLFMLYEGDSGKLATLRDLLVQLKDNGHRPLLFSQFKGMLHLVAAELEALGLDAYTITGSTPVKDRQAMTTAFNKGSRDAFLMSLKAGGVGLNVTGADVVILIDLWWNPAVEMQAIGRAHRMGQEKAVQVYRLVTKGSIEEKILTLQESKRELIAHVLEGQPDRAQLSLEDIREILGIS